MRKKYLIFILIVIFIIISLAFYIYVKTMNKNKIIINTKEGQIKINNIYNKTIESTNDKEIVFERNIDFDIVYFSKDDGFLITINNPNLEDARKKAENKLLEDLGISKEKACLLKLSLTVTADVNQKAAGKNYGLNFCPNSKPFPK